MRVLHIAGIQLLPNGGMGRISFEWKRKFEQLGHQVIHIGSEEVKYRHSLLFAYDVASFIKKAKLSADLVLAHEPTGGFLSFMNTPLVIFSHGVEERAWEVQQQTSFNPTSMKSKLVPKAVRFYSNNRAFRNCQLALLSNREDLQYLIKHKKIRAKKLRIFQNGYYAFDNVQKLSKEIVFLFNATWIPRKGTSLMVRVFNSVLTKYPHVKLLLAGTKLPEEEVRKSFSPDVQRGIQVIASFEREQEPEIYRAANVFVMPTFFEGQSVALTQAMALGLCPVTTSNCGQKDLINHGYNGLLFATGDADGFSSQIIDLINNPGRIDELGSKARSSVLDLTWDHAATDVVKSCEEIFQKSKA